MRIAMLTCGTRGDTQPLVVLGAELRRRGHEVRIAASPNTLGLVRACGFEALPLGPDSQELMESERGQRWLAAGDAAAFMKELDAAGHEVFEQSCAETEAAVEGADQVVAGVLADELGAAYAEARGVPFVAVNQAPYHRQSAYANPLVTTRRLPGPLNAATGALFERVWWAGQKEDVGGLRERLGLPPVKVSILNRHAESAGLEVQAYDQALVPRLRSSAARPLVGFLSLDEELRASLGETGLATDLEEWLGAGDPPVFFGFGSMPVRDPAATVELITEVARAVGVRALVSAGWGALTALEPDAADVRVVGAVDHDQVMPRCLAAVHHGGAGTTAASLGAGLPTVVCSVFADQPFWGARVVDARAGAHLRFTDLSAATLTAALRTAVKPLTSERARALGERLASPRVAAAQAADALEGRLATR